MNKRIINSKISLKHLEKKGLKNRNRNAKLFIVSGPSGSGKNAVVRGLLKKLPNAAQMVTYTTRPPRPGEKTGQDYYFITKSEFKKKIKQKEFIEWACVHQEHYYGTSKKILEKLKKKYQIIVLAIDVQGANSFRKLKNKNRIISAKGRPASGWNNKFLSLPHTSIFINAESKEKLISRIKKRKGGLPLAKLKLRLASAVRETKQAKKYDYRVINYENKLNQTIEKICKIIKAESIRN